MDNILHSYQPDDISCIVTLSNGLTHNLSGFIDGTHIAIERLIVTAEPYAGIDFHARILRRNKSASIMFSLSQTSESNDFLSQVLELGEANLGGDEDVFSLMIKDQSGRSLHYSNQCYIGGPPDLTYSNTIDSRDWMIYAVNLQQNVGGNARFTDDMANAMNVFGQEVPERWQPIS